jgi:hypothetical protein
MAQRRGESTVKPRHKGPGARSDAGNWPTTRPRSTTRPEVALHSSGGTCVGPVSFRPPGARAARRLQRRMRRHNHRRQGNRAPWVRPCSVSLSYCSFCRYWSRSALKTLSKTRATDDILYRSVGARRRWYSYGTCSAPCLPAPFGREQEATERQDDIRPG